MLNKQPCIALSRDSDLFPIETHRMCSIFSHNTKSVLFDILIIFKHNIILNETINRLVQGYYFEDFLQSDHRVNYFMVIQ